jgi:molecular chaperone DnaK
LVARRLREEFLREPSRAVDPDLAVALGAATQAAMHEGQSIGPVLIDVATHTLGIVAAEGPQMFGPRLVFSPIIHRNTPLPARYEQAYYTEHEEQEGANIQVQQGEHEDVQRNQSIGEFLLDLKTGAGQRKIVVGFDLTLDGTLRVAATQTTSGVSKELTITNALSQFQSEQREQAQSRLASMFDSSAELLGAMEHQSSKARQPTKDQSGDSDVSKRFPAAVALLEQVGKLDGSLAEEDAIEISSLSSRLKEALSSGATADVEMLCAELDDILFYVQ